MGRLTVERTIVPLQDWEICYRILALARDANLSTAQSPLSSNAKSTTGLEANLVPHSEYCTNFQELLTWVCDTDTTFFPVKTRWDGAIILGREYTKIRCGYTNKDRKLGYGGDQSFTPVAEVRTDYSCSIPCQDASFSQYIMHLSNHFY
jgi:hypothetical protein